MFHLLYTKKALDDVQKLPPKVGGRILAKMDWFVEQEDPLYFSKVLHGTHAPLHRFRIGNYRVICSVQKGKIQVLLVLTIKHRKDVYR